ncbi:thiopeptide-type bacteriocin biosynthesis protein [Streptomyces sp. C10-9-1]|uniref:thiopeptide-type bacteriocin biosynthesis protein n=1 Tax=Streptomyces sp. C10-9-1 TaxID=1859285 RepID=UPI003D75197F
MSPDQLISAEPSAIQRAVATALTGLPITPVAAGYGMEPAVLSDALAVYHQAGREAPARQASTVEWWQVYLHFTDWTNADETFAAHILPLLQEAENAGLIVGWWYIRKHPCWRLRLRVGSEGAVLGRATGLDRLGLHRLVADGHLLRSWPVVYEPETAAFGGTDSMAAAHALFIADSREAQRLRQDDSPTVGARELSVLLCTHMMRAAKLEWYEQGDVWDRVIAVEHRSALDDVPVARLNALAQGIRPLLLADSDAMVRSGGPLEPVAEWAAAFRSAGQALGHAVQVGKLDRGLRQVLSYHVIFHWNRLGLSMRGQSVLAWAARAAILHGENGT